MVGAVISTFSAPAWMCLDGARGVDEDAGALNHELHLHVLPRQELVGSREDTISMDLAVD